MNTKLLRKKFFLLLVVPMFALVAQAQTENKIVTIADPGDPNKALTYSGTYVYQGTRASYNGSSGGIKIRAYYKCGTNYLYADYLNGRDDFPNGFEWVIRAGSIESRIQTCVYQGWESSDMNYPSSTGPSFNWWWADMSGNEVTVSVTNEVSGVAPSVTTMEASLVTTTSGTMGGNITADGGATADRGFVYSSTDATPTIGEPGVAQITKGTGTGTYTEVVSGLSAGVTYYYQAYAHNTYGTTYGTVKSFITPTTSAPNKMVSNAGGANGIYVWIGEYYGKPAWKHISSNYWLYYSKYGMAYPNERYWYIDDELKDEHGAEDFNYDHLDAASCPSSGWRNPDNSAAAVTIADYPQIDFSGGSTYSPANPTGGTSNNPIGRFYLDADITGASLTAVTINAAGSRTGTNTLRLWSSTDATFNSGSDVLLNSQIDAPTVAFSGFSSSISTSGTYYFVTADLASDASGTFALTIGSKDNLIYNGGASSTVFSNAALASGTITIIETPEIAVDGNYVIINDGDASPSLTDLTDFGSTAIAGGTVVHTFTIYNFGAGTLSLTDVANNFVSITGSEFTLTAPPSGSITNGAPTTFQVTFNPTTTGLKTGTISIANNDYNENPYNFSIEGTGTNATPTDIALSASSITENVAGNTNIGILSTTDADAGDTHTYTLVAGTGDADNASFSISGSNLRITNSPDFETKNSYSVRVRTTDFGGLSYEEAFAVTINNLNEAPTNISLSASAVNENVASNTAVGALTSTDPDTENTFIYTLVAGTGDADNASFNISGENLRITNSPDFETKSFYTVRIRTTDQGSLTYEEAFAVTINNLNEAPTDISLSSSTVNENVAANTTVATLSSTDTDDGNTFTYTLATGTGDADNASFNIIGENLRIIAIPDFETKNSYSIRIRTTDQGSLAHEEAVTVAISNVNEAPTDISLSTSAVNENVASNTTIGDLTSSDPDAENTFTYTLVAGTGDADNASFDINGENLRITNSPDFETKNSYSIRVRTTDQGSLFYEEVFSITINNLNEAPTVTTQAVSSIAITTATGNGTITSLGDPLPNAYGVCWNTTGTPTISDSKADNGAASATGAYTASMTSLSANTTYYVRAFATNEAGTTYGNEVSFETDAIPLPNIAFSNTASSGLESVSSASLQVELSAASASDVTVDYAVTGTAAGSGTDYALANGTLTITAGNTTSSITIASIVDDVLDESDESVIITLSNPVNATLGTNTEYTYIITDNDDATDLEDISEGKVSVYPNPFTNIICFDNLSSNISQIMITDLSGQIIFNTDYKGEKSISLDHLSPGIYLLAIINNTGKKQILKIVKE